MERVLKYNVGRFRAGEIHDWPRQTWDMLAEKVKAGMTMWDITEPVQSAVERGLEVDHGRS